MPRRRRLRRIVAPPQFKGYKPYGASHRSVEGVELLYEEYEALKLTDYDMMNHQEACELMGVSRATFARIYESARKKVARAFVEVREIKTVYGNAYMDDSWYTCKKCHARFTVPKKNDKTSCPICAHQNIELLRNI